MKLWVLLLLLAVTTEAARFLAFFPLAVKSHHYVYRPVLAALAKKGHEVVYYTGYPYEGNIPPGIVQVDLSGELPNIHASINLTEFGDINIVESVKMLFGYTFFFGPFFLGAPTVQKLIHSDEKFDVVLSESVLIHEYQSAFQHKFNAIGIDIISLGDSTWMNELAGLPDNPAYQIDFRAMSTQNMDFWQRLYNTYIYAVTTIGSYYYMNEMETLVNQYFNYTGWESRPPFMQLLCNKSLILVNYHNAVGYPVPKPPHRKDIAGVTIQPRKPLPKQIQEIMDEAVNGVIYFSLGTNINISDPANERLFEVFLKVFEKVPQKVLMKFEAKYEGKLPSNIHLEKWYPQQDVLAHKNCVLFITHGGYLSLVEAVHFGVPVIGIPFFGDQRKNFFFVEESGIGKMLNIRDIQYDSVSRMVKEVLSNKTYKEEMARRSKIFRDRPLKPADEAVFWIEHVIKYPDVLKPKAISLSFIELHLIDVKMFIMAVLIVVIFIVWKSVKILFRIFNRRSIPRKEKIS